MLKFLEINTHPFLHGDAFYRQAISFEKHFVTFLSSLQQKKIQIKAEYLFCKIKLSFVKI